MFDGERGLAVSRRILDAMALRAKVIAHNVANQNTVGFKRFEVVFEERLRQAHARGEPTAQVAAEVRRDTSGEPGVNNVSVADELATLEKVRLLADVFSRRVGGYLRTMKKVIYGRTGG